jgi:multiple sugar transport system permease protein
MEARAARWKPAGGRWRHALESRRVLALLLIAPAVVFMALVVGVPFLWAIYLSFTDAVGGSLTGNWVGFDNFTSAVQDDNFRRAVRNTLIFTLASQAIVLVGAAVLSNFLVKDFRGKWFVRFLVVLPWATPVVLSTIGWLWLLDSLYSVVSRASTSTTRSSGSSAQCISRRARRCRSSGWDDRTSRSSRSRSSTPGGSSRSPS